MLQNTEEYIVFTILKYGLRDSRGNLVMFILFTKSFLLFCCFFFHEYEQIFSFKMQDFCLEQTVHAMMKWKIIVNVVFTLSVSQMERNCYTVQFNGNF